MVEETKVDVVAAVVVVGIGVGPFLMAIGHLLHFVLLDTCLSPTYISRETNSL